MLGSAVKMMADGIAPSLAINLISLNAARHLNRDHELGSIEVGKRADLVAFSPRDTFAVVTNVWVDGMARLRAGNATEAREPRVA
jgi:alpha-D-ribose 1-methylphosphonate 5-triphosphate diphosphatase